MPLDEAVPGFKDTITLAMSGGGWGGQDVDILRWRSFHSAPRLILSSPSNSSGDGEWFGGLDAAGSRIVLHDEYGVVTVRRVTSAGNDLIWGEPTGEAVGLRALSSAWHDTEPGRLAWVSCARGQDGPATVFTLDVADRSAETVLVTSVPDVCNGFPVWIDRWGDWGFALGGDGVRMEEDDLEEGYEWTTLLDSHGVELALFDDRPSEVNLVAAGPAGTVWNEEPVPNQPVSFLLSLDGQRRDPVPGLTATEWVDEARWSPDGSRIALAKLSVVHPWIRIADTATGETLFEIEEANSVVWQPHWSSEGRFLLYARASQGSSETSLVVYDTAAAASVAEVSFPAGRSLEEIRLAAPAEELTPMEWSIALDDSGPGTHTVFMILDVGALLIDEVSRLGGRLMWDQVVVDLCGVSIRGVDLGSLHIGDIYQTSEGCGANPTAMQDAFDEFGLPGTACLTFRFDDQDHDYCAPLSVEPALP